MSNMFKLCFIMMAAVSGILGGEPVCSQFNMFEKTIEKRIRLEHFVQSTNDKMLKWEHIMDDNIKRLDKHEQTLGDTIENKFNEVQTTLENAMSKWNETLQSKLFEINIKEESRRTSKTKMLETFEKDRTSQTEILNTAIDGFQNQIESMILNISNQQMFLDHNILEIIEQYRTSQKEMIDTVFNGLEHQVESMFLNISNQQEIIENAVAKIKEELFTEAAPTPTVLFRARDVLDTTPSHGDTLVYTIVDKNLHSDLDGGYDSKTGIFKAPVPGTYLFMVQTCLSANNYIYVQIIAGEVVLTASTYQELWQSNYTCYSESAITTLSAGDTAYIKCRAAFAYKEVLGDYIDSYWNMFSGVLIN